MSRGFLALLAALIACFFGLALLYWSGLGGGFFFDDEANILYVESLKLQGLSISDLKMAWLSGVSGPGGRPVAQVSFALNQYFGGFDPFLFKATNLVIHLSVGVLVFFVARRLLFAPVFAGIAALLWLLHPIQLTAVLYVVQRMTSLSALFLLAALLLHIVGRERAGRSGILSIVIAWGVFWPLSFFSKESGVLFPLFVLAWELIIRHSAVRRLDCFARFLVFGVGICLAISLVYAVIPAGQWLWAGYEMRSFSLSERLLTEGRVLWFYLGLIVFPRLESFGLNHDDFISSSGLLVPWLTVPAWLGLLALVWLAWHVRLRAPLVAFGITWFLVGHSLESTVLPLELVHEHRNYLPSFGIVLVGVWALMRAVEKPGWQKTLGIALAIAISSYSALVTGLRAHQFGDELRRTQMEALHHPESARTQYEAARALVLFMEISSVDSPNYYFARTYYERAGRLSSDFKLSWLGLIHLDCMVKSPTNNIWVDELARRLRETPLGPGDRGVLLAVKEMSIAGTLCLDRQAVEKLFAAALANATTNTSLQAVLHSWLADYLTLVSHDLPAAETELNKSLSINPNDSGNLLKQVQLTYLQGRYDEARKMLARLDGRSFTRTDRGTMALLGDCLASSESVVKCTGK